MIKVYAIETIGVDDEDDDRTLFKLRTFDASSATLTVADTLLEESDVKPFCKALKKAMKRMKLEQPDAD